MVMIPREKPEADLEAPCQEGLPAAWGWKRAWGGGGVHSLHSPDLNVCWMRQRPGAWTFVVLLSTDPETQLCSLCLKRSPGQAELEGSWYHGGAATTVANNCGWFPWFLPRPPGSLRLSKQTHVWREPAYCYFEEFEQLRCFPWDSGSKSTTNGQPSWKRRNGVSSLVPSSAATWTAPLIPRCPPIMLQKLSTPQSSPRCPRGGEGPAERSQCLVSHCDWEQHVHRLLKT